MVDRHSSNCVIVIMLTVKKINDIVNRESYDKVQDSVSLHAIRSSGQGSSSVECITIPSITWRLYIIMKNVQVQYALVQIMRKELETRNHYALIQHVAWNFHD